MNSEPQLTESLIQVLNEFGGIVNDVLLKNYERTKLPIRERTICHMRNRMLSRVSWEFCAKYLEDNGYCIRELADRTTTGERKIAIMFPNIEYAKNELFDAQALWETNYQSDNRFDLKDKTYLKRDRRTSEEARLAKQIMIDNRRKPGRPKGSRNKSIIARQALHEAAPSLLSACIEVYSEYKDTMSPEILNKVKLALTIAKAGVLNA